VARCKKLHVIEYERTAREKGWYLLPCRALEKELSPAACFSAGPEHCFERLQMRLRDEKIIKRCTHDLVQGQFDKL
jgi:hypothetical protein